jgi:hypothetical protein
MSDPSAPSDLEKRSTDATVSTPLKFSVLRLALAFVIAGLSDVIGAFATLAPPIGWAVDVVTAALLFVVLGWQWLLLPGLVLEAVPGVGVLPFWLLVVGAIAVLGAPRPKIGQRWGVASVGSERVSQMMDRRGKRAWLGRKRESAYGPRRSAGELWNSPLIGGKAEFSLRDGVYDLERSG